MVFFSIQAQAQTTGSLNVANGTLSWTISTSKGKCGPGSPPAYSFTEYQFTGFQFYYSGGGTYTMSGSDAYFIDQNPTGCPPPGGVVTELAFPSGLDTLMGNPIGCTLDFTATSSSSGTATLDPTNCQETTLLKPAYQVVSILYDPPGNKSQAGFMETAQYGTTTTVGSNFTAGTSVSFTEGASFLGTGASMSETFGTSVSTTSSSALQETFSDSTGVANMNESYNPDAINHNQDIFLVFLNPEVQIHSVGGNPINYGVLIPPPINGQDSIVDILPVSANVMEANSAGVTTVPLSVLVPQNLEPSNPSELWPGLGAICANNAIYKQQIIDDEQAVLNGTIPPEDCTLTNQCGCTPNDFLPILQMDPLLFYNGMNKPPTAYPGYVSPLTANTNNGTASDADCDVLPLGSNLSNNLEMSCRYVPVANGISPTTDYTQKTVGLSGPEYPGDSNAPNTFQQGDMTQSTITMGGQTQESVAFGFTEKAPGFSFTNNNSFTWTQSQSVRIANSTTDTMNVSLNSQTVGCEQSISIWEDTVFHTFVFTQPSPSEESNSFCSTATATPTFSPAAGIYATPQTVVIADAAQGATIYYTTDVTTPTLTSKVYSGPIQVTVNETLKAISFETGWAVSGVGSAEYTIQ